ncbi:MAG: hypothetical protein JWM91_2688 [Rhodospirillales bacterium]|nr:hypothetical protein [Rhodospirillales bacterium]
MTSPLRTESWEEVYLYWLSRHVDGQPPRRADIDPMIDLPHMASNLIMIELRHDGAEYRLIGSEVVSYFGVDRTGKEVGTSNVDPKQLEAWRRAVGSVGRNGQAHMLISHYPGGTKSTVALLVPLAPDGDGVTKVFGAAFFGQPFPITDAFKDLVVNEVVLNL